MRDARAPRALKRSLLAAVGVLAIASTAVQPATTHTATHTRAAARHALGDRDRRADTQPTQRAERSAARGRDHSRASLRPLPRRSTPRTAAAGAHTPSARDRTQQRPAARTPARHTSAAHQPHRRRDSWTAHFAILDTHGRQTTTAQLVLSATDGPWKLAELIPPDPDTLITPNPPALPPTGPAAARRAALGFTHSYLDYTYDHPAAGQLRDLTPKLRASITANPPRVPANIRALHPRIASLALTRDGARWLADANVTDGQDTYQITSVLARVHGDWLVVALRPAG